ncbi:MAG: hypothetical protein N2205_00245 [Candidatus Caldatribacterium sp.]|nr:hypothetical protein [Candidatus Caldatribacterium sp.]MCX7729632.1 hypothetical protein [Candidatus Caldatribacterium sp.]MDW8080952.1 hypothetical protein [Candidatus Calescibacterium sp.]
METQKSTLKRSTRELLEHAKKNKEGKDFPSSKFGKREVPGFRKVVPPSFPVKNKGSTKIIAEQTKVTAYCAKTNLKKTGKIPRVGERTSLNLSRKAIQPEKQ